ncbi:MAG: hypothetical protein HDS06_00190 [Bacteroides sp.]|nr:hypothetical protein [Bacteroides sp.]
MNKILIAGITLLPAVWLSSCNTEENSIDDYPLNYEITEVKATQNIPVGCILYNPYGDLNDAGKWERLEEEYDAAAGHIGPNMVPSAGVYRFMGTSKDEEDQNEYARQIGRIVGEMKTAGVDFLITPATRESAQLYPNNINPEDSLFLNIISGRNKDLEWHNDGSMKFAIQINMQNFANANGFDNSSTSIELRPDQTYTYEDEEGETHTVTMTQWERFMSYARNLAKYMNDDTYYRTADGRPVVYFREPEKFFVQEIENFYNDFRSAVQSVCGANPYIICSLKNWDIAPRYQYIVLNGKPDALAPRNMADLRASMDRFYLWDILQNENFKKNREWLGDNFPTIDFIPSVSNGYLEYVMNVNYRYPPMYPSVSELKKRCWIAKMNIGKQPMVIIDSFNDWGHGSFIETSDPNVGKGVGDEFLKVIKSEFKIN